MKSIITKYTKNCMFCGRPTMTPHHFLFGNSMRALADRDHVQAPVCDYCHTLGDVKSRIHDNVMAEKMSKVIGQLAWEKHQVASGLTEDEAREAFRNRYGQSYL